jgi:hypothetical protein
MKKAHAKPKTVREVDNDDILPEYDFSKGRRNKYAARYDGVRRERADSEQWGDHRRRRGSALDLSEYRRTA